jgi:hypothetical protein
MDNRAYLYLGADLRFLDPHNALVAVESIRDLDPQIALFSVASSGGRRVGQKHR